MVQEMVTNDTMGNKTPVQFLGIQVSISLLLVNLQYIPITENLHSLLFQTQIFPKDFELLQREDIEVFLSPKMPILGIDAKPHPNPKVCFIGVVPFTIESFATC